MANRELALSDKCQKAMQSAIKDFRRAEKCMPLICGQAIFTDLTKYANLDETFCNHEMFPKYACVENVAKQRLVPLLF